MTHSTLAPSSASRRMQCPGSRVMSETYPQAEDDPRAAEGTLAHAVNLAYYMAKPIPDGATDEMLDGAELWQETISAMLNEGGPVVFGFEEPIKIDSVHPECFGTPDFWCYLTDSHKIHVVDYKFGHRFVDEFENWQLLEYAVGVVDKCWRDMPGCFDNDIRAILNLEIVLTVVQPRCYAKGGPVRSWTINGEQYGEYFKKLQKSEALSMAPDAVVRTGAECRDCSGRHACAALHQAASHEIEMSVVNAPFDLSANVQGWELKNIKKAIAILEARESGLENEVLAKMKQGVSVAGWRTEQGTGREKWDKPIEEVLALGGMMGVDIAKPSAITPKQAIKKGLPAELVAQYSVTPIGEIKLAVDNVSVARKIFKQ
jgi:Protein of unknown function (DUF2800)